MQDPQALVASIAMITASIALFNGFLTTIGQSKVAVAAIESVARQPGAAGPIRTNMFIGLAMAETGGIYGLVIAFLILFANPFIGLFA